MIPEAILYPISKWFTLAKTNNITFENEYIYARMWNRDHNKACFWIFSMFFNDVNIAKEKCSPKTYQKVVVGIIMIIIIIYSEKKMEHVPTGIFLWEFLKDITVYDMSYSSE